MNVFSCFDGASCGQLALQKLGIPISNYYASEIDKYAMQVTQANFPNTIQLGDITKVDVSQLPKIDLMMGGSPCQGFSFAGKQLNFEDPRSKLFFDFIRLRDKLKPKYVLLENVRMKKESEDIISDYMGCSPIKINSSLLSAQSRNRLYWFVELIDDKYVPINVSQPQDKGIVIKDILEELPFGDIPNYLANNWGGEPRGNKVKSIDDPKANCLTASMYKGQIPTFVKKPIKVGMMVEKVKVRKHEVDVSNLQKLLRGAKTSSGKTNKQIANDTDMPITKVEHWFRTDSSFAIPSDNIWYKLKDVLSINVDSFDKQIMEFEYRDGVYESTQRVYSDYGKSPTITASNMAQFIETTLDDPKENFPTYIKKIIPKENPTVSKDGLIRVGSADLNGHDYLKRVYSRHGKAPTLTANGGGNLEPKVGIARIVNRRLDENGTRKDYQLELPFTKVIELRQDDKSNCLTTLQKDNVVVKEEVYAWRKLTPLECERLQTMPDNYTNHVSNSQRYKMIGNGWTVDVIAHILKGIQHG